jgi:hypothetical protein
MLQNKKLKSKLRYHKLQFGSVENLMGDIDQEESQSPGLSVVLKYM